MRFRLPRRLQEPVTVSGASLPTAGAAAVASVLMSGCSAFDAHRRDLAVLHSQGRFEEAAAVMDRPATQDLYGKKNRLLYWLDRGAIALAEHNHQTTIELLEQAEAMMELKRETSTADAAAKWLINDTAAPYIGEPYEDIYVNVLKLLAQLEAGNLRGGATVEARRVSRKADVLRDRYLAYTRAVNDKGGAGFEAAAQRGSVVPVNEEGQFVESTLGTFLTAVTFMETGDGESQKVAARRLESSFELQRNVIGPVQPESFDGLGDRRADSANVLLVALSGRTPRKEAERFGPIPIFDWPVYFELPVLVGGSQDAAGARVVWAPITGADTCEPAIEPSAAQRLDLALVEDMSSVAVENHRRELPFIYARTLLRSSIKAGASFAATQVVRNSTDNDAAIIGAIIGGLVFVAASERADLRSWIFLPGRADVGLFDLDPGPARVRVEYLSPNGGVLYTSPWRTIEIPDDGLVTVVEHYWK